jgi:pyrroline-5-carboxylate reductase
LLANLAHNGSPKPSSQKDSSSNDDRKSLFNGHTLAPTDSDSQKPTQFIACVRAPQSAERLRANLSKFHHAPVTILQGENARAIQAADTILLGCQPQDLEACLGVPSVAKALKGKLLISILAGVTIPQIEGILSPSKATQNSNGSLSSPHTIIVRAMPNTASFVRASTTVISSTPTATPSALSLVDWLFSTIGTVTHITAGQFDACTALCGSTPAFFALFIESLLDGAVALGLKRSEAQTMAAETMKGAAMLMLAGESPDLLMEKVATPGGSTIQGLLALERKALRGIVADALIRCTAAAGSLGEGH